jgi:hypothetical protein
VKRTRGFVKKYYSGDTIRGPDGVLRPIVFRKAVPITVRYDLDRTAPGLFDAVADALDPVNGANVVSFARYAPAAFSNEQDEEVGEATETAAGLLRSGLLKRFEQAAEDRPEEVVRASPIWMGLGSAPLRRKGGEVGPVLSAVRLQRRQNLARSFGAHYLGRLPF